MKRAVIIDDVENARISLRKDLEDYCPSIQLVGEAGGVLEGMKVLKAHKPEIVFLDIHMKDGSGFDLLELYDQLPFAVIFTTSSDAHATRAFRFSAVDYLLKPIDIEELKDAVGRVDKLRAPQLGLLKSNLEGRLGRIVLNAQDRVDVVEVEAIVRLQSQGSYTVFHLRDKSQIIATKTLKEYDELLSPEGFIRTHQSHLVNSRFIRSFIKRDGGTLLLTDGSEVDVSSRKRSEVMRLLGL